MSRVYVYVDGFNLYYGQCQGRKGRRWLDLRSLAVTLRPHDEIVMIRYFSAWVRGTNKAIRQNVYMRALRTLPGWFDQMSYFQRKEALLPLVSDGADVWVWKLQEKGSDVNLASHLLLDAEDGAWEEAVVISNDQDLTTPVRLASERHGPVHVYAPNNNPGSDLEKAAKIAGSYQHLYASYVRRCQFPDEMTDARGTFHKPEDW